jgi:predicted TIM-barrel fold metal-dependent hydrolase
VARPGSLDEYFRGRSPRGQDIVAAFGKLEPIRAEYRDRDARLAVMDAQGVEGCFLFPTQGVGLEEALRHDPDALYATLEAFNTWLEEDWGFHYRDRLFAAPLLSLVDPDRAAAELERVLDRGARIVCLRPGPVLTPTGGRSPGDPCHDAFWSLADEAGIVVGFHGGDSGYERYAADWGEGGDFQSFKATPFRSVVNTDRPIFETIAALVIHGTFARHANLRVASIEIGATWVPELLWRLRKSYRMVPSAYHLDPEETFRTHLWVSPFYEDDIRTVADTLGIDHVLMGSDWPHAEGLPQPSDYYKDLARQGFNTDEVRRIMRDNGLALARPRVAAPA